MPPPDHPGPPPKFHGGRDILFRTNGAGYPSQGSAREPLHQEGGIVQDGATQSPEDRSCDADGKIIFQAGPQQGLTETAPDLCSVLVSSSVA
jgi:hypothetical protein